jgi:hypothetical protein
MDNGAVARVFVGACSGPGAKLAGNLVEAGGELDVVVLLTTDP